MDGDFHVGCFGIVGESVTEPEYDLVLFVIGSVVEDNEPRDWKLYQPAAVTVKTIVLKNLLYRDVR